MIETVDKLPDSPESGKTVWLAVAPALYSKMIFESGSWRCIGMMGLPFEAQQMLK